MNRVRPELRSTRRTLRTGVMLHCIDSGPDRAAETVLFLHGYGDSWLAAQPSLPFLPPGWRVIAPDQRGHGRSESPPDGYDIPTLAADAAALLEEAGVAGATLVGHSMGSFVAQQLALDHPARVRRLVLVGAGASIAGAARDEIEAALEGFADEVPREFIDEFYASVVAKPLPPDFVAALVSESVRMPARVWRALIASFAHFDTRPALARIRVPTRIVWGDADGFFDRGDQERLLAGIASSTLSVYEGCGHCPNWEEPERFARELVAFVRSTDPPR